MISHRNEECAVGRLGSGLGLAVVEHRRGDGGGEVGNVRGGLEGDDDEVQGGALGARDQECWRGEVWREGTGFALFTPIGVSLLMTKITKKAPTNRESGLARLGGVTREVPRFADGHIDRGRMVWEAAAGHNAGAADKQRGPSPVAPPTANANCEAGPVVWGKRRNVVPVPPASSLMLASVKPTTGSFNETESLFELREGRNRRAMERVGVGPWVSVLWVVSGWRVWGFEGFGGGGDLVQRFRPRRC